nr:uncharacterized protein LOC123774708 isoform X1 [Procambarus clarkii]
MNPENVALQALRDALQKEVWNMQMEAIDGFAKDMQKRKIELSVTIEGEESILSEVRSATSALKGKAQTAMTTRECLICQEVCQPAEETSMTANIVDKDNEVDKSSEEAESDDNKIKTDKSEKSDDNEKHNKKASEVDKEEKKDDIIKTEKVDESEENRRKIGNEMAVDKVTQERVIRKTIILRLVRENGKLVCQVRDGESGRGANQLEKTMAAIPATSETRISLQLTLDDGEEKHNKLSSIEDSNVATFLHEFLCDIRQQVENIFEGSHLLDEPRKTLVGESKSIEDSNKTLLRENPKETHESPKEIQENPKDLQESLKYLQESPRDLKENP